MNVNLKYYDVAIIAKQHYNSDSNSWEIIEWKELPFEIRMKWDWYFKYRAALMQVKYPKWIVELRQNSYEAPNGCLMRKTYLNNLIISRKRMITMFKNDIADLKSKWTELFPIEEHPKFNPTIQKIDSYECELKQYQDQFNTEFGNQQ